MAWFDVLEHKPDARVVTDATLRVNIERTELPWRVKDKTTGIEMLLVPPGRYQRGKSLGDSDAFGDEEPAHPVTLTKAFYLGRYEVTQEQWQRVMGNNPSTTTRDPRAPVENVTFDDISVVFLTKSGGLRLPTEAEWEYACRAGTTSAHHGALDDIAWYSDNSGDGTHSVGSKRANAFGLHDMLGNVWEWCADWYSDAEYGNPVAGVTDPKGPPYGESRVQRGGSWRLPDRFCRASFRDVHWLAPDRGDFGFRVARTP